MESPGIRVPLESGEDVRKRLLDEGALRTDLKVKRDGDSLLMPITDAMHAGGFPVVTATFEAQTAPPRSYHDHLDAIPAHLRSYAPSAFDVLGHVAIVKIPDELAAHKADVGNAILQALKNVRTVCADGGVTGPFRVRDLTVIAGDPVTLTEHREHGLRYRVDPARAYFSPRLGTERARVASLVAEGEHVVDLFAGVGPWAIMIAKEGRAARVDAVDLNPEAVDLLRVNIELNRLGDAVVAHLADAHAFARDPAHARSADRVIMNVPHSAADFLEDALILIRARGGTIHHHAILGEGEIDAHVADLAERARLVGREIRLARRRIVRAYSPQESHFALDLRVLPVPA